MRIVSRETEAHSALYSDCIAEEPLPARHQKCHDESDRRDRVEEDDV